MITVFKNPGEIDPRLIRTFGVNVKEDDSAIGFFGTGLKYAIAILLRNDNKIKIYSGVDEYIFGTKTESIRGKAFTFVTMNDELLGFTTDVGKSWDFWTAYRELYSNCVDENGEHYTLDVDTTTAQKGYTHIVVEGCKLANMSKEHHKYFITTTPLYEHPTAAIHKGENSGLFYRGIRAAAFDHNLTSKYTYNILSETALTEDRTIRNHYTAMTAIVNAIINCPDEEIIADIITNVPGTYEEILDYSTWAWGKPGPVFTEVVGYLNRTNMNIVNLSAVRLCESYNITNSEPEPYQLDSVEQKVLDKSIDFCEKLGFNVANYPIKTTTGLGNNSLGLAKNNTIYIAKAAFTIGSKTVAGTLIEEYIHLKYGYGDMTRELQNLLLNDLVNIGEKYLGEPL